MGFSMYYNELYNQGWTLNTRRSLALWDSARTCVYYIDI